VGSATGAPSGRGSQCLPKPWPNAETFVGARGKFDSSVADDQIESIVNMFDAPHGGFGRSPEFPHPAALDLLLERHQAGGGARLLEVAATTLEKMGSGGVYDQIAGGFHRYSVDDAGACRISRKCRTTISRNVEDFCTAIRLPEPFCAKWPKASSMDQPLCSRIKCGADFCEARTPDKR